MNIEEAVRISAGKLDALEKEHVNRIIQENSLNPKYLESILFSAIDDCLKKVITLQKEDKKKPIQFIVFSLLYSNLLLHHYAFRIDVLDSDFWNDETPITSEWDISYFIEGCDLEFKKIMSLLSSNYIKIAPYEEEELYRGYLLDFIKIAAAYLTTNIAKIQKMESFQLLEKEADFKVLLGEYRDHTQKIWPVGD